MNVPPSTIYAFGLTVWGVIHLLVGLALLVIGIALLRGQTWGRVAGMFAAAVSAIINIVWLPYSPLWAIMVIAVDILIIWALASYLRHPRGRHRTTKPRCLTFPQDALSRLTIRAGLRSKQTRQRSSSATSQQQ